MQQATATDAVAVVKRYFSAVNETRLDDLAARVRLVTLRTGVLSIAGGGMVKQDHDRRLTPLIELLGGAATLHFQPVSVDLGGLVRTS